MLEMTEPKTMVIACKKCGYVFGIRPRNRYKLKDHECKECKATNPRNWIIDGYSDEKCFEELECKHSYKGTVINGKNYYEPCMRCGKDLAE